MAYQLCSFLSNTSENNSVYIYIWEYLTNIKNTQELLSTIIISKLEEKRT